MRSDVFSLTRRFSVVQVICLLCALALSCPSPADHEPKAAEDPSRAEKEAHPASADAVSLADAVRGLESLPVEDIWSEIHRLRERFPGRDPLPYQSIAGKLPSLGEKSRFGAAVLVLVGLPSSKQDLRIEAQAVLRAIARQGSSSELRASAVGVLARHGHPDSFVNYPHLRAIREGTDDAAVKIACCLALWRLNNDTSEVIPLRSMLEDPAFDVRAEAALALATTGHLDERVREILRRLREEPAERGERAGLLLKISARTAVESPSLDRYEELVRQNRELERSVRELSAAGVSGDDALGDLIEFARERYVAPARVHVEELYRAAVRAIVESLDDHAEFFGPDEPQGGSTSSMGQYLGLGARLTKLEPDGPLIVTQPFYRGPAYNPDVRYEDRLLTGDRILEIDGMPTAGLDIDRARSLLAVKEKGDLILLKVQRDSGRPRWLRVRYDTVEVPTGFHDLFPERIGYVKLHYFGPGAALELEEAYRDLDRRSEGGLAGLILDLRDNPGGVLEEAVRVADLFVTDDHDHPIVSETRPDGVPSEDHLPTSHRVVECPLVVLVNRWTASAAEVVAGALQGYGRAVLVGQRTFGKGVSQDTLEVPRAVQQLIGGPARVRIPTRFLEVPPGRRFHRSGRHGNDVPETEGGIRPDVTVAEAEDDLEGWKLDEFRRVQYSVELSRYVRAHFEAMKELSYGERWSADSYPEFDALYSELAEKLAIRLTKEEVLLALRALFRQHLADRLAREQPRDPREDKALQKALGELLDRLGREPEESPAYSRWLGGE